MRVTAADLDERRILAPARRLIEKLPVAAGGARGRLTTPVQIEGLAVSKHEPSKRAESRKARKNNKVSLEKLARARAPRERDIQRDILAYLASVPGIYAWKAGSGLLPIEGGRRVRMGKAGVADVIGWVVLHVVRYDDEPPELQRCRRARGRECYYPRHVPVWFAIEVKRPKGGKPATPAQLDFLARLREAGSPLALLVTSVDQVRRAVEAL